MLGEQTQTVLMGCISDLSVGGEAPYMGLIWGQSESFREEVIRVEWGRSLSGSYLEDRRTAHFGRSEQEGGLRALAAERLERRLVIVWLVRCL